MAGEGVCGRERSGPRGQPVLGAPSHHSELALLCCGMQTAAPATAQSTAQHSTAQPSPLTWSDVFMAPPGAQGHAATAPVVAFVAASKTGTRPVAMSTGACPLPLASMGSTRNTGQGRRGDRREADQCGLCVDCHGIQASVGLGRGGPACYPLFSYLLHAHAQACTHTSTTQIASTPPPPRSPA